MGHIDFAPHFQKFRRTLQRMGDIPDGGKVLGHIFAHDTVALGGTPHKNAIFIFQAHRKPVNLCLHHVFRGNACFPHTGVKFPQFFIRKRILKAFHFDGVGHLGKLCAGSPSHMLGGAGCGHQLREGLFDFFQFPGQLVILKILQLRSVLIIIQAVVPLNHRTKFFRPFSGLFQFHAFPLHSNKCAVPRISRFAAHIRRQNRKRKSRSNWTGN